MQHWLSHSLKLVWRLILASNVIQMRSNDFFPQYMFSRQTNRIICATLDEKWGNQVLEFELWGDQTGPYTHKKISTTKIQQVQNTTYLVHRSTKNFLKFLASTKYCFNPKNVIFDTCYISLYFYSRYFCFYKTLIGWFIVSQ